MTSFSPPGRPRLAARAGSAGAGCSAELAARADAKAHQNPWL
ncbi:hypothetical protein I552_5315 [Mycobacterium xenopi 3993]|nr:hypothetical protein I552_5315 [Mycobacterium xenopi 3993]